MPPGYQQSGVLRTARLQSFPPPLVNANNLIVQRRSSFPSVPPVPTVHPQQSMSSQSVSSLMAQQQTQANIQPTTLQSSNSLQRRPRPLFAPLNTSLDYSAPFSPSNAYSPTNSFSNNSPNPLNFRLEMPSIIRPSEEVVGEQQTFDQY